jgi:hypothetical protein
MRSFTATLCLLNPSLIHRTATFEPLSSLLKWSKDINILSDYLPVCRVEPVTSYPLRHVGHLIATTTSVRVCCLSVLYVIISVSIDCKLQLNSALKAVVVGVLARNN